jgi:integrase
MARQRKSRIYWKDGRAYADFRDHARWDGRLEALKAPGSRTATSDPDEAMRLCAARLDELQVLKQAYPDGLPPPEREEEDELARIAAFAGYHLACLERRRKRGRALTQRVLAERKKHLLVATRFFAKRGKHLLTDITTADVRAWLADLEVNPPLADGKRHGGLTGPLTDGTRAKYLHTLNSMLRRAWREERIDNNPVDRLDPDERPSPSSEVTPFLEVGEAALILEVARRGAHRGRSRAQNYVRMAVHLLTGGRGSEVKGLEKADLDFVDHWIWIRPNATRRNVNKVRGTARRVPMWPQLRAILEEYLAGPHVPDGPRLFDGTDCRKWMDEIAADVGWEKKRVRLKVFRVTYASARIQTLDNGAPVSDWTVQQEMGHGSMRMLQEVYVRVGSIRQRRNRVEYLWEDFAEQYAPLLRAAYTLPARWRAVLDALPPGGASTSEWERSAGVAVGTFYYIRSRLADRGLILKVGRNRGTRYYRAVPNAVEIVAPPEVPQFEHRAVA